MGTIERPLSSVTAPDSHPKRLALPVIAILAAVAIGIFVINYAALQSPMDDVLQSDERNRGIQVRVHYKNYVDSDTLIYDLREVGAKRSPADVFRVLLQFAARMKEKHFERVVLAYGGNDRFVLRGNYFKTLGTEYGKQNPIYTMRTFPQNVLTADGLAAFPQHEGGWLVVMTKQMQEFNEFHRRWYAADVVADDATAIGDDDITNDEAMEEEAPESKEVSPETSVPSHLIVDNPDLEVVSIDSKVTESNDSWSKHAWVLIVKNRSMEAKRFDATIQWTDESSFIIDEDVAYNLEISPMTEETFMGYDLITADAAKNVSQITAKIRNR